MTRCTRFKQVLAGVGHYRVDEQVELIEQTSASMNGTRVPLAPTVMFSPGCCLSRARTLDGD